MRDGLPIKEYLWDFWIRILEKLDEFDTDIFQPIPNALRELNEYFHFGCSFIYQADHVGRFSLRASCCAYDNQHLQDSFSLHTVLEPAEVQALAQCRSIVFDSSVHKDDLENKLAALFRANTLILIPVTDGNRKLLALVGVADRRGASRPGDIDIAYSYSILRVIANYIKMELYQQQIQRAEQSLRSIMDNMNVDVYVSDRDTHEILYANRSMAALYGGEEQLLGKRCCDALSDHRTGTCDDGQHSCGMGGQLVHGGSWDFCHPKTRSWRRVSSTEFQWIDGRMAYVVSSMDITENKLHEEMIRRLAELDDLTGLPNRRRLLMDLAQHMQASDELVREGYALFFDLDGFKAINDTFGHQAGDELLCEIGKFLEDDNLTHGWSYRYGGDEFVVLCPAHPAKRIGQTIALLRERFSNPWQLTSLEVRCGASIGIAHTPGDTLDPDELLHKADMAMYAAKQQGKGSVMFYHSGDFCNAEHFLALLKDTTEEKE